jgi:hypothetical protein
VSLVFTMPGKLGDALLQWPVAFHYCRQQESKCTLWLDEKTLKPLVPLFEAQPCVEKVELKSGIENYSMGGQPWNFNMKTEDHLDHEVYHLGFRAFPSRQISLETLNNVPLHIDSRDVATEDSLQVSPQETHDRVVLHGTFASHTSGVPGFWRFLYDIKNELPEMVFVGTKPERARALELYPDAKEFNDEGNFLKLAEFVKGSRMVIGSGSSVCALASVLHVPCVRVHDPIGEAPRVIWSGLGDNQLNESERDLRKLWPEFRDKYLGVPA